MFEGITAVIDRVKGKDPEYEACLRGWRKGEGFPYHLFSRDMWPAPFWKLVSEERVYGRCPNCGSHQQLGPKDVFPKTYSCGACGFSGEHPLYSKEQLQKRFHMTPGMHGNLPAGMHNN